MLALAAVHKAFGGKAVLRQVSLQVSAGEVVGLVGPNGAGKTTLLRIAVGLLDADAGTASIGGLDVGRRRSQAQALVGYLAETSPLPAELTVQSYLWYRAGLKGVARAPRRAAVERAVALTDLTAVRGQVIATLSKGFRQRVGLADAVLADPPLLLLDEPGSGLDPMAARALRDQLRQISASRAVLLSSHALGELEVLATRVAVMFDGRVIADAPPAALCAERGAASLQDAVVGMLEDAAREVRA
jgi:ABC-2 type transport system ATP-binding protein